MAEKRPAGLKKRDGVWRIDKVFMGMHLRESTGTGKSPKARDYLAKRLTGVSASKNAGERDVPIFRSAAARFLQEYRHNRRIDDDALHLKLLYKYIGDLELKQVHMGSLQEFIARRRHDGVKTKTINAALAVVRRVLNLAASEWMDDQGNTWLETAPRIKLFPIRDSRSPYPLTREEQGLLFQELPDHLARMALFKVNTGTREHEVCGLQWDYEVKVPELDTSVFLIPSEHVKNGDERLVVLNQVARSVVENMRGLHPVHVFAYAPRNGQLRPLARMNNTAWRAARSRAAKSWERVHGEPAPAGFRKVRVHDLKHTFGRRLRAAGVSFEDRQDLLGHRSGRITTHYSQAELSNLIAAAEQACDIGKGKLPETTWLRRKSG